MATGETWLKEKLDKIRNDPEFLREYIKLLEEEIEALRAQLPKPEAPDAP